jgi:hypothetical protein
LLGQQRKRPIWRREYKFIFKADAGLWELSDIPGQYARTVAAKSPSAERPLAGSPGFRS